MSNLLAIALLKGFYCHDSQCFAPKIAFRYEEDNWIIQLLFLQTSLNPNELEVIKFLKLYIDKKFINKDIVFILKNDQIKDVNEYYETIYQEKLSGFQYEQFQKYLLNDNHNHPFIKKQPIIENDNFYIAESTLQNAGYGLFAKKNFHKNETLLEFKGKLLSYADFCLKYPISKSCIHHEYSVMAENHNRKKYIFDPIDDTNQNFIHTADNFGPVINEPFENNYSNCESVSVSSPTVQLHVDVVATRFIATNEELFMLYNREPDKDYIPGYACPLPIELKFKKKPINATKLYCIGMNWYNNKDWFRLVYWHNNTEYSPICVSEKIPPIEFQQFHINIKNFIPKSILFIDYTYPLDFLTQNTDFAIVGFLRHTETDVSPIYNLLKQNTKCLIEFYENNDFIFDSYEFRKLDNTHPLLKITYKKNMSYTRFRDVWDEQRIVNDMSLSDEKTVQWLKNYKRDLFPLKTLIVPSSKPLTLQFTQEIR